jgi:hypothetical protein
MGKRSEEDIKVRGSRSKLLALAIVRTCQMHVGPGEKGGKGGARLYKERRWIGHKLQGQGEIHWNKLDFINTNPGPKNPKPSPLNPQTKDLKCHGWRPDPMTNL